ncbi:MAG: hypothetical protein K2J54_04630 [Clostridia bacterium]|nr:hypothetical protein [Clostridia bacterium]
MFWLYITLWCLAGAALVALTVLFVWCQNNLITVTEYSVESGKAPENGVKIVQISDLHGKSFGKGNVRLIKKAAARRPDL